ncbi:MAG: sigma-70 family RNA polymerase sigma factor [Tannerellaceae bacterium]|jgi:RNA polymerase sigma-70 factor (ECF subfamily)|nr:sigma-70 family RNA polymerase sigma factor [Tannerellaceae bacterium]
MDTDTFKQQFLPLHPRLYRTAFILTGNSRDAEDILQEAYCKLWEKRKELSHIRNPEAFCVTLVKHLCLDFIRSSGQDRKSEPVDTVSLPAEESPEAEIIGQDQIRQMQQLINRLPENQQQVIRLRGFNDCSLEEIEEITGLSAVNVRVLLSRARKTIREHYVKLTDYERQRIKTTH